MEAAPLAHIERPATGAVPWLPLAVMVVAGVWPFVAAAFSGGNPWPMLGSYLAAALAFVVAWQVASGSTWRRILVPLIVVTAAGALLFSSPEGVFSTRPLQGPFGYANAKAAFFAQAAVAAAMLVAGSPSRLPRLVGLAATVTFAAVPVASGSLAAVVPLVLVPAALLASSRRGARLIMTGCMICVVTVLAGTIVLAASEPSEGASDRGGSLLHASLTAQRLSLWHDALVIMADQPLTGVGPGRFGLVSPTARADRDTRSAHNEFLHQGAESGVVGFLMLLVVFMAVLGRLRFTPSPDAFTALGAVAIAVLGIHASVDYVLRFPALSVVASALAGAAAAPIGWRRMASA